VINYDTNNVITLTGVVTSEKEVSHEIYGEVFYRFNLEVQRLSGNADTIPVTVSERLDITHELAVGQKIKVDGQFRSYNNYVGEKSRLVLTVFAKEISFLNEEEAIENPNTVELNGFICKKPIYRQTPFGREIADILLAVNRAYNKSDYIPAIAWGRNARFCQNLEVGQNVKIYGRVQSRMYEKKYEDGTVENKIAYEVSISRLEVVKEETAEQEHEAEESNVEAV